MTSRPPWTYRILMASAPALAASLSPFSQAIAEARRGRQESFRQVREWSGSRRSREPLILWHAPSAGEWRQAEPVFQRLRRLHPHWQWALTYTSPSAAAVVAPLGAELHGYLPWDRASDISSLLTALHPSLLVCTKLDLWPELAFQARQRQIPLVLIAATVRPGSGRLRWPARAVLRRAYSAVTRAGAVSPEDAMRLEQLGVPADRIDVLGDPRADAVLERIEGRASTVSPSPLLVAGSTWPPDEVVLLEALARVRLSWPAARLLLAPHEPGPGTRERLARLGTRLRLPPAASADQRDQGETIRVIETVGGLALAYGEGWLAYVGGGFGTAGLHSVLEPAAWGLPVLVGPRWRESLDARQLAEAGALVPLGHDPVAELARHWERWLADDAARQAAGAAARRVVERARGAADRSAALVAGLLETDRGRA